MIDLFGENSLRGLVWKNPFGPLMIHGKKETRSWNTSYRGEVVIISGLGFYSEQQLLSLCGQVQLDRINYTLNGYDLKANSGKAIAIGLLIDTWIMRPEDEDACFVKYDPKLFVHNYIEIQPIIPSPIKGKLGWMKGLNKNNFTFL